jgi:potassium-transporting ATPase KdpC subunit
MQRDISTAAILFVLLTIVTGLVYPGVVTGVAQLAMLDAANGSLISRDGKAVGSTLIGQPFSDSKYFWSRPSATGPQPYNGMASSGSNQGPTNPALVDAVKERIAALKAVDPDNTARVPQDLVTASASGLDPHISPAAADYQLRRVARVRGLEESKVRALVAAYTEPRQFGVLGEPRVNVLPLNRALDAMR